MKLTPLIFSLKSSDDRCLRSTVRSYSTYRLVAVWIRRVHSDVGLVSVGPPHERDALGG